MVELKSAGNENEDEGFSELSAKVAGQVQNAHNRGIVGIFPFRASSSRSSTGLITVAHDSAKIWRMDEIENRSVNIVEKHVLGEWRMATQSCDATPDGKNILVLGIDCILKEIVLSEEGPQMLKHDFGYGETVHVKISSNGKNYLTASFSGNLTEIDTDGKISRQTPLQNAKHASCIACSPNNQYIAVAMVEGTVNIFHAESFTLQNTFEVHSMKIRTVAFTLDNANFLTGSDDKTIKMHSIHGSGDKPAGVIRMYCGNRDPVTCVMIDERSNGYRFASSNMAAQIYLWHLEMQTPIQSVPVVHTCPINSIVFTPRGRHLLSVGDDKSIVCYSIPTSEDALSSKEPTPEPEDIELEPEPDYLEMNMEQQEVVQEESQMIGYSDQPAEGSFQEPELRMRQYQADISQYMESQYPDQSTYQDSDMSMNPETRAENIDQVEDGDENSGQGLEVNMEEEPTHEFVVPKVEPQSQSQNQTQEPEQEADQLETDDGERQQQEGEQNPDHESYPDFQEQDSPNPPPMNVHVKSESGNYPSQQNEDEDQ
ncbi:hypothetical protein WR25_09434 isoform A [Diploscapter pachys]|uniref:Uncharacterized protein n=1 Tax=Diploscapter pachys TaxID=2018661 RepID=A0A2A2K3V1_9BILA|nr:hypothetical protein WR25_09434 isoform A [Diploscapter pachys]